MNTKTFITLIGLVVVASIFLALSGSKTTVSVGGVSRGEQYQATTTDSTTWTLGTAKVVATGNGILGSVVVPVTSAVAGLSFYDATTTDVLKRTGNTATTTILLAKFPVTTVGTYVFDVGYKTALLVESTGTAIASSTVTYKRQ